VSVGGGHPGDLLSALLDGELSVADADQVRAHVRDCLDCARELDEVREARFLLRTLPAVDPPTDLFTRSGRESPRRWGAIPPRTQVAVSIAASVALFVLAAGGVQPGSLVPPMASVMDRHASTVSALDLRSGLVPAGEATPTTAPRRDPDRLPAPFDAPQVLGDYHLVDAYRAGDGLHLLYRDGRYGLSVFEQQGSLDWDELPVDEGSRVDLAGRDGWRWDAAPVDGRVVVFEDDGMVVTVVGDEPGDAVLDVARLLPAPRDLPMFERMERAATRALELFSPL